MKIRPVGAELLHADRLTDRHNEANSGFSQFCKSVWKLNSILFLFSASIIFSSWKNRRVFCWTINI